MTPATHLERNEYMHLPELYSVEGDSYVYVAVLEDPAIDGNSNWLTQTFEVDPHAGPPSELHVDVTERYQCAGEETLTAFTEQYGVTVEVEETAWRPGVEFVREALETWYMNNYRIERTQRPADATDGPSEAPI